MDTEDIDQWYEDEKEKLTQAYRTKISKIKFHMDNEKDEGKFNAYVKTKTKLKEKFTRQIDSLHTKYEKKMKSNLDSGLMLHFLKHRWHMFVKKIFKYEPKKKEQ